MNKLMAKIFVVLLILLDNSSSAQINIPDAGAVTRPVPGGSWLRFETGGNATSIVENWGLNLVGSPNQQVKIRNTSLLLGYDSGNENYGVGNAIISGKVCIGTASINSVYRLDVNGGIGGRAMMGNGSTGQLYEINPYEIASHDNGGWTGTMFGVRTGGLNVSSRPITQNLIANSPAYQQAWAMTFCTDKLATNGAAFTLWAGDATQPNTEMSEVFKVKSDGTVKAKQIRIELTGWADHVFKPEYQKPSLKKLDEYIFKEGHLPGIPSEAEVKAKGVDVGEVQRLLLQKVEELTLYLIEKDKQLGLQQRELISLRKEVKRISSVKTSKTDSRGK